MHHTERGTEAQSARFLTRRTDNLQCVGSGVVAVDGVASHTTSPASSNVDLVVHGCNGKAPDAWLGKVVQSSPAGGHQVVREHGANGPLGNADSKSWMFGDLLRHTAEYVEHIVNRNGKFARDLLAWHAWQLRPGL